MKKVWISVAVILFLGVMGYGIFLNVSKADMNNFIIKDSDIVGFSKGNNKDMIELNKRIEDYMKEKMPAEYEKTKASMELNKYIKRTLVVHEFQKFEDIKSPKDIKLAIIFDSGDLYSLALTQLDKYFTKDGINYILKDEYINAILQQEHIYEIYKNEAKNIKIYMRPYKGYFILTFSSDYLDKYINLVKKGKTNERMLEKIKAEKNKNTYFIVDANKIYNNYKKNIPENNYITDLDFLTVYSEYIKSKDLIVSSIKLSGKGEIFKLLSTNELKNRKLENSISENELYLANNSFPSLIKYILDGIKKYKGTDYLSVLDLFTGGKGENLINSIGNEIILKATAKGEISGVLDLNSKNELEGIFKNLGLLAQNGKYTISNKMNISFDKDNRLVLNDYKLENSNIKLDKNIFLYSNINLWKLIPKLKLKNSNYKISGISDGKSIELKFSFDVKALFDILDLASSVENNKKAKTMDSKKISK